jgi:uncharacterized protein (TIGR02996 family)
VHIDPTHNGQQTAEDEGFLREIVAHPDDELRLIYADWLDERGDQRGQLLRLEAEIAALSAWNDRRLRLRAHLRRLLGGVDAAWRARLDRTRLDACPAGRLGLEVVCPERWEYLTPTEQPAVRGCPSCGQNVRHCVTLKEAQRRVREGECVAVDSGRSTEPSAAGSTSTSAVGRTPARKASSSRSIRAGCSCA